ncbi:MAG TPA: GAF domain-containing sensor histidine kinase [Candidatus Xenobia bacterium]
MRERLDPGVQHLLRVTRSISQVLDVDDLLERVLDAAIEVTGAERGCLLILDPKEVASPDQYIQKRVFRKISPSDLETSEFKPSLTVIGKVMETRAGLIQSDAVALPDASVSIMSAHLRSILCEPLLIRKDLVGIIYLDSSTIASLFTEYHQDLLRSFAAQAAICLENARLFSEVQEATRRHMEEELRLRELETRKDVLSAFVAIASHDLKNPLTVIKGGLQILERLEIPPIGQELLVHMERSAQRAIRLVQTYLDALSLEEGQKLDLRSKPVVLAELVDREIETVAARLPDDRRSRFTFDNQMPRDLRVEADEGRLEQIVGNLIDNAVKYSPEGGVIQVRARTNGEAVVEIQDHGLGIDDEARQRLFQRFVRVGKAKNILGSGLGLWIVRRLVELQGGTIEVDSVPGQGSTFRFTLPLPKPVSDEPNQT